MSELNDKINVSSYSSSTNGEITFSNEVIATIVGTCISDVEGLSELAGGNVVDGITSMFGKKNITKGIKIELGKEEIKVSLSISVKYGYAVPKICAEIQEKISKAIESMTGLKVTDISINVTGITVDNDKENAITKK